MAETNSSYDMQRLQQEAIQRAREMQARAQSAVGQQPRRPAEQRAPAPGSVPVRHGPERHIPEQHEPKSTEAEPPRPEAELKNSLPGPVRDIFDTLMEDKERNLILIMLLILMEEKADTGVILALMYLIL